MREVVCLDLFLDSAEEMEDEIEIDVLILFIFIHFCVNVVLISHVLDIFLMKLSCIVVLGLVKW